MVIGGSHQASRGAGPPRPATKLPEKSGFLNLNVTPFGDKSFADPPRVSRISPDWSFALSRTTTIRFAAGALLALSLSSGALADPSDGQAEWAQRYDAAEKLMVSRSTTPLLSEQTVTATERAIEQYRQIVTDGGWQPVPGGLQLSVGSNGPAVSALRRRLIASGDVGPETGASPVFDSYVEAAVRRFQARHGFNETGVVTPQTLSALNVPAEERLRQLEINLNRLKSVTHDLGNRMVVANIPAAHVETVENGQVITHHIAGVGKIDRQSPIQSLLDRAGLGDPQGSDPEDAE